MIGRVGEPGVRLRTIGLSSVPLLAVLAPASPYVPVFTHATWPLVKVAVALRSVHGAFRVPGFLSLPFGSM